MPDRMPEDMPDRMPEDMSDRMPEDLPVTKCINVMVGITRSKVILYTFWVFLWSMDMGLLFNNGNMFRKVSVLLVRDVNTPPTPPSPLMNIRQRCATC